MERNNYVVIHTYHERYAFETRAHLYYEKTIEEICKDCYYNIEDGEMINGAFIIDKSIHSEIDNEYTYPGINKDEVQHIHLDTIAIIPLNDFFDNKGCTWVWGVTESKFGLLDKKRQDDIKRGRNIFSLAESEFRAYLERKFSMYDADQLLQELKDCGLKVEIDDERRKNFFPDGAPTENLEEKMGVKAYKFEVEPEPKYLNWEEHN